MDSRAQLCVATQATNVKSHFCISPTSTLGQFILSLSPPVLNLENVVCDDDDPQSIRKSVSGSVTGETGLSLRDAGLTTLKVGFEWADSGEIRVPVPTTLKIEAMLDISGNAFMQIPMNGHLGYPDVNFHKVCSSARMSDPVLVLRPARDSSLNMHMLLQFMQYSNHPFGSATTAKLLTTNEESTRIVYCPSRNNWIDISLTVEIGQFHWVPNQIIGSEIQVHLHRSITNINTSFPKPTTINVLSMLLFGGDGSHLKADLSFGRVDAQLHVEPAGSEIKSIIRKLFGSIPCCDSQQITMNSQDPFNININWKRKEILGLEALLNLDVKLSSGLSLQVESLISIPYWSERESVIEHADLKIKDVIGGQIDTPNAINSLQIGDPTFSFCYEDSHYRVTGIIDDLFLLINDFGLCGTRFRCVYKTQDGLIETITILKDSLYCQYDFSQRKWQITGQLQSLEFAQFSLIFDVPVRSKLQHLSLSWTLVDISIQADISNQDYSVSALIVDPNMSGQIHYWQSPGNPNGKICITASKAQLESFCKLLTDVNLVLNNLKTEVVIMF